MESILHAFQISILELSDERSTDALICVKRPLRHALQRLIQIKSPPERMEHD